MEYACRRPDILLLLDYGIYLRVWWKYVSPIFGQIDSKEVDKTVRGLKSAKHKFTFKSTTSYDMEEVYSTYLLCDARLPDLHVQT